MRLDEALFTEARNKPHSIKLYETDKHTVYMLFDKEDAQTLFGSSHAKWNPDQMDDSFLIVSKQNPEDRWWINTYYGEMYHSDDNRKREDVWSSSGAYKTTFDREFADDPKLREWIKKRLVRHFSEGHSRRIMGEDALDKPLVEYAGQTYSYYADDLMGEMPAKVFCDDTIGEVWDIFDNGYVPELHELDYMLSHQPPEKVAEILERHGVDLENIYDSLVELEDNGEEEDLIDAIKRGADDANSNAQASEYVNYVKDCLNGAMPKGITYSVDYENGKIDVNVTEEYLNEYHDDIIEAWADNSYEDDIENVLRDYVSQDISDRFGYDEDRDFYGDVSYDDFWEFVYDRFDLEGIE